MLRLYPQHWLRHPTLSSYPLHIPEKGYARSEPGRRREHNTCRSTLTCCMLNNVGDMGKECI